MIVIDLCMFQSSTISAVSAWLYLPFVLIVFSVFFLPHVIMANKWLIDWLIEWRAFLIAGALSMFFGWTRNRTLSKEDNPDDPCSLVFFTCSRTRCRAVSPSSSSASKFAPDTQSTFYQSESSVTRWPTGTVPDLRSRGRGFDSRPWLLCTKANSACHSCGVG